MSARKIAYEILKDVFLNNSYSGLLLRNNLNECNEKDKSLITQIVYGTIRNYRLLSFQYSNLISKKVSKEIDILLSMSIYQLFMMDKIPNYAVVNEAVSLTNNKSFVNAILRKVIKQGFKQTDNLSIKYSLPDFIINLWKSHYGENICVKIAGNLLKESKVYGRINSLKTNKEELSKDKKIKFIDDFCFEYDGNLILSQYFKDGKVIIQDYSSQQVCKYLELKENLYVLDLCAAPGTKTSQIAMMMNNTGKIVAVDIHEHRVKLIEGLIEKLNIKNVDCVVCDAKNVDNDIKFDRILVDAPCSGIGVLKGKPDIKLKLNPEDLDEIVKIQKEILNSCKNKLNVNGILVYSTCTLNKKENERQIELFVKENPNFELIEQRCIFPFEFDSDGFYIAKLIKKE